MAADLSHVAFSSSFAFIDVPCGAWRADLRARQPAARSQLFRCWDQTDQNSWGCFARRGERAVWHSLWCDSEFLHAWPSCTSQPGVLASDLCSPTTRP